MQEQEALRQLENQKSSVTREQKKVTAQHTELVNRAKQLQNRRSTWEKSLREMRDVQESEIRKEKEEKQQRINVEKAKIDVLEQEISSMKAAFSEKEALRAGLLRKSREADDNLNRLKNEVADYKRKLQRAISACNDKARIFGEDTQKILDLLKKYQRNFSEIPIGPIGYHISIKDQKWVKAIDSATHALHNSFIVSTFQDQENFLRLLEMNRIRRTPVIIQRFRHHPYEIPREQIPSVLTVHQTITADHPMIINVLIDQLSIERIALAENSQAAVTALRTENNISKIYDISGVEYRKRGQQELTDASGINKRAKLGVDLEEEKMHYQELIKEKEIELRELARIKEEAAQELRAFDSSTNRDQKMLSMKAREVDEIKRKIRAIEQEPEMEDNSEARSELERSIQTIDAEIDELTLQREAKKAEIAKLGEQLLPIQEEIEKYADDNKDLAFRLKKLEDVVTKVSQAKRNLDTGKENRKQAKAKLEAMVAEAKEKLAELKANLQEITAQAEQKCERMELDPERDTPAKLDALINSLKNTIERETANKRPLQRIREDFALAKKRYNELNGEINRLTEIHEKVQENLASRTALWAKLLKTTSNQVKHSFRAYLSQKGFSGQIVIDHEQGTLDLAVKPNSASDTQQDTRSLSGGERSFSTVAFLMSLWEVMDVPFCAMDEFDVFMDGVARKISIDLLVDMGVTNQSRQFLFISPGDPKQIPTQSGLVRIHKMNPPVRNQGTLPFASQGREEDSE
eukprot:TRINITY_DN9286_c0_g1_i1.p1 TRINITY_DN9286_c0_g1~~TRINITY_DN9286_c0_g1_i1.p1  ORF type:complete len:798 (+),score=191.18 TRINITY_DN9286_c0_g1_i1:148-2394(+)